MTPPKHVELFMNINRYGFKRQKDDLGYYFTKGDIKISCMKSGPMYLCYYNKLIDSQWIMQAKTYQPLGFESALKWVIQTIQSIGAVH